MPLALVIAGALFCIVGVNGKQHDLITLLRGDFTGANNFVVWSASIVAIGAVGYYKPLRPVSNGFLLLVILAIFIKNRGVFDNLKAALQQSNSGSHTSQGLPQVGSVGTLTPVSPFGG